MRGHSLQRQKKGRQFRSYEEYKDTGIPWLGSIPSHWDLQKLKRVVVFAGGGTPTKDVPEYWSGDIPWVSPKDMKSRIVSNTEEKITSEGVANSATRIVPKGCVLVVVRSGILQHSIPVALAETAVALNQDLKALIPGEEIHGPYLAALIEGHQAPFLLEWRKEGATVESLELELVKNSVIPIPPIAEQKAIATFVYHETAKIDKLLAKKLRLIDLLKERGTALITQAVTKGLDPNMPMKHSGLEWLGEISAHWNLRPLAQIAIRITYGFTNPMPAADDGPYMLTANDIGDGVVLWDQARRTTEMAFRRDLTDKSRPVAQDILITKDGTLGRVAMTDGRPACINQSVALLRIRHEAASADFVQLAMRAHAYQERILFEAGGTAIRHIYVSRLAKMPIALPPEEEQRSISGFISEHLSKADVAIYTLFQAISRLRELRTALISAAVTGKIDVRGEPT